MGITKTEKKKRRNRKTKTAINKIIMQINRQYRIIYCLIRNITNRLGQSILLLSTLMNFNIYVWIMVTRNVNKPFQFQIEKCGVLDMHMLKLFLLFFSFFLFFLPSFSLFLSAISKTVSRLNIHSDSLSYFFLSTFVVVG